MLCNQRELDQNVWHSLRPIQSYRAMTKRSNLLLEYLRQRLLAVIADGALAGETPQASILSLPAAATTVIPEFVNLRIASLTLVDALPPIERLTTACVFGLVLSGERIQSRPAITVENDPNPPQPRILTGTTIAFFATPYFVPAAVVAT